jgi:hypothetical protein
MEIGGLELVDMESLSHSLAGEICTRMWRCFSETGRGKISDISAVVRSRSANCETSLPRDCMRVARVSSGSTSSGLWSYQEEVSEFMLSIEEAYLPKHKICRIDVAKLLLDECVQVGYASFAGCDREG